MLCMKCGREIEPERVFCPDCLADMEKYPVKPGTVVQIPRRPSQPQLKKGTNYRRQPAVPLEEQIKRLKKRVAVLTCSLILAIAAIAGLCWLVVDQYFENLDKVLPGQNYSSITTTESETGE